MVVAATARPLPYEDPLNHPLVEGSGHTTSASYRKSSRVTRWTGEGQLTLTIHCTNPCACLQRHTDDVFKSD